MIRAIIVDDEIKVLRNLDLLITKFVPDIKVVATATNPLEAVQQIEDYHPDIVFLDISMPQMNGFEMLEKLVYREFKLVFTTAHAEYAIQAIRSSAFDYLLKPVVTAELQKIAEKVKLMNDKNTHVEELVSLLTQLHEKQNKRIALPGKDNTEYVPAQDIIYIEASSRNSFVMLKNGSIVTVTRSLKEYEEQLCINDQNFMRIHHSFIVNINYIKRYIKENGGQIVMEGKKIIPVSKSRKEEFLALLKI